MSSAERLTLWIEQMGEAAENACDFIEGMDFAAFEGDKRTQQAVVLNLLLIGKRPRGSSRASRRSSLHTRRSRGLP